MFYLTIVTKYYITVTFGWHDSTVIIRKVEKNFISNFSLFHPPTLNIICFVEKYIFEALRVTLLKMIVLSRFLGK